MRRLVFPSLFLLPLSGFLACAPAATENEVEPAGSEGGACYGNGTCDDGLSCLSNTCVFVPSEDAEDNSADQPPTDFFQGYYRGVLELSEDSCSLGAPRRLDIDFFVVQDGTDLSVELPNGEVMEGVAHPNSFSVTTTYSGSTGLTMVTTSIIANDVTPSEAFITREFSTRYVDDGSECLVISSGYVIRESD